MLPRLCRATTSPHGARAFAAILASGVIVAVAPVLAHAGVHYAPFGLSELHTSSNNTDSLQVGPLAAGWTWHHVYPRAIDSHGKDWRLNTDNVILVTQALGLDLVLTLWTARTYTAQSFFPSDTTAWKDSVQAVVERYDGDGVSDFNGLITPVKYWHVEEELSWWGSTWAQYSTYLGITRRAILAADPTAKVICAGLDSNQLWGCGYRSGYIQMPPSSTMNYSQSSLDRYEAKIDTVLGGGFYDIVDMHSYEQESILRGKRDYVRSLMYNATLPIWCIEASAPLLTRAQGYSDTLNAQMVVRLFAEAFAIGIPRYSDILYQYPTGSVFYIEPWTNLSMTLGTSTIQLKPSYYTYMQMTQMIGGWSTASDLTARTSTEDRDIFCIRFVAGTQTTDVYWCDHDTTTSAPVTQAYAKITHILTVAGDTPANAVVEYRSATNGYVALAIGRDPIYVQSSATGIVDVVAPLEALAARDAAGLLLASSPARERTVLRWHVPRAARNSLVALSVYSPVGRLMLRQSVGAAELETGAALQLRDTRGRPLRPGLYWVEARLPDGLRRTARLVVVD